jgi:superfamily II DNA or RNA helicase
VEVDAGVGVALVTGLDAAQAPLVLRRQVEAEAAALEALRAWLPEGFDARLRGDAAWGFLLEGLPLLKLAMERLRPQGWGWLYLDGQTQERQALVERWNHPEGPPLFLISLKAGGTGLNLTGADCVIHLDPWWNPAAEAQATDRAHRIGQSKPVHVYRLVARDTVEEAILGLQERKRALLEGALDGESALARALTREDLERLLDDPAPPPPPPAGVSTPATPSTSGGGRRGR